MKLYMVPFRQEARLLTAILPNCRSVHAYSGYQQAKSAQPALSTSKSNQSSLTPNPQSPTPLTIWEYNGGRVVCWNQAGSAGVEDVVAKISDFSLYSEVIMFGSAGSLAHGLSMGQLFCCTTVKDTFGGCWHLPQLDGLPECGILSTEALVFDNEKRNEFWQKHHCELVDMETAAFARLASLGAFGSAAFGAIRFVSDTYEILPALDPITNAFTGKFPPEVRNQITQHRRLFTQR